MPYINGKVTTDTFVITQVDYPQAISSKKYVFS